MPPGCQQLNLLVCEDVQHRLCLFLQRSVQNIVFGSGVFKSALKVHACIIYHIFLKSQTVEISKSNCSLSGQYIDNLSIIILSIIFTDEELSSPIMVHV